MTVHSVVAPSSKLRSKGRCGVFAGKTVWSTPERLRGEVLTTRRYTNLRLSLPLPGLVGFSLTPCPYILFYTIPPRPSQAREGTAVKEVKWREVHTHASLMAIVPGKPGLASSPWLSISNLFNTTHRALLPQEKVWRWRKTNGGKVHSMTGNWCRDFKAGCPSCCQPVLKVSTGTHPFFNHQQTPERRHIAPFYVCSHVLTSVTKVNFK